MMRTIQIALMMLVVALPMASHAQVCREKGGATSGKANLECDMRYRNQVITCDKKNPDDVNEVLGTRPACPPKPMPMIDTPKKSYISDYSPYLYIYPRDDKDRSKPYAGAYALGTPGDASRVFQLVGNSAPGSTRLASCTTQIKVPTPPTTDADFAKLVRLQLDNCTNQYILNAAIFPVQKENVNLLSGDNPKNAAEKQTLASECQPLKIAQGEDNEYEPADYLKAAWIKLLIDPKHRKTTGVLAGVPCVDNNVPCDREPHLPTGVTLDNPLPLPDNFPEEIPLSLIAAVDYEEINDPTHPFSPRWDYLLSDRDYANQSEVALAPVSLTALTIKRAMKTYLTEEKNTVFCAGVKSADQEKDAKKKANLEVKVDVLTFRKGEVDKASLAALASNVGAVQALTLLKNIDTKKFESALFKRVAYNNICYNNKPIFNGEWKRDPIGIAAVIAGSFCYQTAPQGLPPFIMVKGLPCWQCYGLNGKVDDISTFPPCRTNYLDSSKDGRMKLLKAQFPGALNEFKRNANCGTPFKQVCNDLRKPFTPLNKLKMRYHNPNDEDDKDGNNKVFKGGKDGKDGPLEGMAFSEYFGNHMPYPKIWDLGHALHTTPITAKNFQYPLDTTGQYTAIVGVGREAAAKAAFGGSGSTSSNSNDKPEDKFPDQRCKAMGWGSSSSTPASSAPSTPAAGSGAAPAASAGTPAASTGATPAPAATPAASGASGTASTISNALKKVPMTFSGVSLTIPDPVTSWTEMKLYQVRSLRHVGLSCIARYEKVFKPGSAENMMMLVAGGEWRKVIITKCDRDQQNQGKNCKYITLRDYIKAGKPSDDAKTMYLKQEQPTLLPLAWRGYLATEIEKNRFPNFGGKATTSGTAPATGGGTIPAAGGAAPAASGTNSTTITGLDKAKQGDIVLMPNGPSDNASKPGLAKLAFVVETRLPSRTNCEKKKNCYIRVLEPDNGKWPDVCGTTDTWGEMKSRYYFKPGHLPDEAKTTYESIKSIGTCEETKISHCEQTAWSKLKLYRIKDDRRDGCKKKNKAIDCEEDE